MDIIKLIRKNVMHHCGGSFLKHIISIYHVASPSRMKWLSSIMTIHVACDNVIYNMIIYTNLKFEHFNFIQVYIIYYGIIYRIFILSNFFQCQNWMCIVWSMGYKNECTNSMFMMSQPKWFKIRYIYVKLKLYFNIKNTNVSFLLINYIVQMWKEHAHIYISCLHETYDDS
jgi:hypothetical protein